VLAEPAAPAAQAADPLQRARRVSQEVAAVFAAEVDQHARFPVEAISALAGERLLGAAVPVEFGGLGLEITELVEIAATLAQGCAATAMIWAMHQIQLACLVRHGQDSPFVRHWLAQAAADQLLIASVTSEVGTGGDIRTSIAAVESDEAGRYRLAKHGATVSYGAQAHALLVTARRDPAADSGDQVLVLLPVLGGTFEPTGGWDTLGMRGTCSPPGRVSATLDADQILSVPFATICAQTMVPYSHVLWAACWRGIASDAVRRARQYARARAARGGGVDRRLADATGLLQQLRASVSLTAQAVSRHSRLDESAAELGLAIELNQLKLGASELVVRIVSLALAICGMAGYQNDGPYGLGRHLRDAYSAGCMINNERLREANAGMVLLAKGGL
jgi:acyl-CoA dehydrogenase